MIKFIFLIIFTLAYFGFQLWYTIYRKKNHIPVQAKCLLNYDTETGEITQRYNRHKPRAIIYSYTYNGIPYIRKEHNPVLTSRNRLGDFDIIYVNPKIPFMFISEAKYKLNLVTLPIVTVVILAIEIIIGIQTFA